jgi:hypothetical protein
MSLLELKNIVIAYGKVEALNGLTWCVEQGEIVTLRLERRREEYYAPHHFRIDSPAVRYDAFPWPTDRSALA